MDKIYIKNKKMFKNKLQMVIYGILFIAIIIAFIYIGNIDFKSDRNNKKVLSSIEDNNVFVTTTANKVRAMINSGNGIIPFGTENTWVNYYATIVNKSAKESGIDKIYYYDFVEDRKNYNGIYENIVELLKIYTTVSDTGRKNIYAPTLLVMKNGKVLLYDYETSFVKGNITPDKYWNEYTINEKRNDLNEVFKKYLES